MTLAYRIREVLRAASGPMTAREVREELDDESATPENVGSTLSYMCKTGEVMRDAPSAMGSATYLIDTSYVPKRAPKQDVAEKVAEKIARNIASSAKAAVAKRGRHAGDKEKAPPQREKKSAAKRAIAKRVPRDPKIGTALTLNAGRFATSVAAMLEGGSGAGVTVHIDRGQLRGLALAVIALHPGPMPDGLKSTVLTAVEATL
jgi:hypothetical protein